MKKRKSSFRAITVRIIALAVCLWLCIVLLLTFTAAQDMLRQVEYATMEYTRQVSHDRFVYEAELADLPGAMEAAMIRDLNFPYLSMKFENLYPFMLPQMPATLLSTDWLWGKWDLQYGCSFAVVYFDEDGEPIMTSGNRMTFSYTDEKSWKSGDLEPQGLAWVDLDAIEGGGEFVRKYMGDHYMSVMWAGEFLPVIRLTGWFEGNEFHPTALERGWYTGSHAALYDESNYQIFDQRGKVEWELLLTGPADPKQETVTLYGWDVSGSVGFDEKPVNVDGQEYENLTDYRLSARNDGGTIRGLWESVTMDSSREEDSYGTYSYSLTVRSWPLQYAMLRLIPAYLVITAVMALAVGLILRRIRRNLTDPLERLTAAIADGGTIRPEARWAEPYALECHCEDVRQALAETKAENTRLNTALEYTKTAEENRRQLVSGVTHELKSPLTVIHSYAEGLQSEIAPEKKAQYVQVILEEAERMDGMVMQMLELSRLEAGRVKLEMDRFSLSAVIRRVAAKLEPLMGKKSLNLTLELDGEVDMNGDETRMEQVITNYLSNAVRYTPQGGDIVVRAISGVRGVYFNILNTARHLSEDGLRKVYDSFYREDASRTEKSTGLGLAIVKQVMALHGSQCYVNNTTLNGQTAVEFGFYPQD